jgi:hypothetical protein
VVKIFQQNNLFAATMLLLVIFALRLYPVFYNYTPMFNTNAPLADILFKYLNSLPSYDSISVISSGILLYLQALMVNYLGNRHQILYKYSMLPALFFVVLNSIYKDQLFLTPHLISNTFIILMIYRLCFLYDYEKPTFPVFDCGAFLGLAILFNYDLILLLPFILIAITTITSFNIRYLFVALLGIFVPIYFLAAIFFMVNRFDMILLSFEASFAKTYLKAFDLSFKNNLPWLVILPISASSVVRLQYNFFKNNVKSRRLLFMMAQLLIFGVLMLFAEDAFYGFALGYGAIAGSFSIAYYFLGEKRPVLKEFLFWLLIISVVTAHFIA